MPLNESQCVRCSLAAFCLFTPVDPDRVLLCKRCKRATVLLPAAKEGYQNRTTWSPHMVSKIPACVDIRRIEFDWLCSTCTNDVWNLADQQHKEQKRERRKNLKGGGKAWGRK